MRACRFVWVEENDRPLVWKAQHHNNCKECDLVWQQRVERNNLWTLVRSTDGTVVHMLPAVRTEPRARRVFTSPTHHGGTKTTKKEDPTNEKQSFKGSVVGDGLAQFRIQHLVPFLVQMHVVIIVVVSLESIVSS
jgi:hypothetical protein